jgi:hypothetical protein
MSVMYGSVEKEGSNFELESIAPQRSSRRSGWLVAMAIGAFVVIAMIAGASMQTKPNMSITNTEESSMEDSLYGFGESDFPACSEDDLSLHAINEYGLFSAPYPFLQEGELLIEPYKNTSLELSGDLVESAEHQYRWKFDNHMKGIIHSGVTILLNRHDVGHDNVTVYVFSGKMEKSVCKLRKKVYYKYVKREIRDLTDDDRERFLDAMYQLWKYDTEEGKIVFGDKFVGMSTYVEEHSRASSDIMCDEFHDGTGFLTHHLALTNSFEQSIREVDSTVTVPYWDFSKDGEAIFSEGKDPSHLLEISDIFTEKWFGSVNENNQIADGRWAHIPMYKAKDTSDVTPNSYGYLRSYWNNNNADEVNRGLFNVCGLEAKTHPIPTCVSHYRLVNISTLADFLRLSPAEGHGPMHVHIGGVWGGCSEAYESFKAKWSDLLEANMTDDEISALGITPGEYTYVGNVATRKIAIEEQIISHHYHVYRGFWRSHICANDTAKALLVCPESCDEGTDLEDCSCQVDSLVSGDMDWTNLYPCVLSTADARAVFSKLVPDEMMEDLVYMLSTSGVVEGEMIESASPADPLFWVIHPVIEKLLQAKRLETDVKFGDLLIPHFDVPDGSEEEWYEWSMYNFEAGRIAWHPAEYNCTGHGKDDEVLPSALPLTSKLHNAADINNDGRITNWEFYLALNPNDPTLNDYVFDNFDWMHCVDDASSLVMKPDPVPF